jgi:AcrR family transcriptional regulator
VGGDETLRVLLFHVMEAIVDTAAPSVLVDDAPRSSEQRVAEALLRCMGRWGLGKTTVEDIAREAGMSRATAYRLFPAGKTQILETAIRSEIRKLVDALSVDIDASPDAESCLVAIVHRTSVFLEGHEALRFTLKHEPLVLEQYLGFERVDAILCTAADMLAPALLRHYDATDARAAVVWLARLVLSYVQTPSPELDLTDPAGARRLVTTFVSPGLQASRPDGTVPSPMNPSSTDDI